MRNDEVITARCVIIFDDGCIICEEYSYTHSTKISAFYHLNWLSYSRKTENLNYKKTSNGFIIPLKVPYLSSKMMGVGPLQKKRNTCNPVKVDYYIIWRLSLFSYADMVLQIMVD